MVVHAVGLSPLATQSGQVCVGEWLRYLSGTSHPLDAGAVHVLLDRETWRIDAVDYGLILQDRV